MRLTRRDYDWVNILLIEEKQETFSPITFSPIIGYVELKNGSKSYSTKNERCIGFNFTYHSIYNSKYYYV